MQLFTLLLIFLPLADAYTQICTSGFTLSGNKCLRLFSNPVSYASSESTCALFGGTVATVKNAIENRALTSFVGSAASRVWLGLYCTKSAVENCYWSDDSGSAVNYNSFSRSFPNVDAGKCAHYLVSGGSAGQWVSASCQGEQNAFVCELPTTVYDTCTYNYNGYCYIPSYTFYHELLPLSGARQICELYGFELASISSTNDIRFIKTIPMMAYSTGMLLDGQKYLARVIPSPPSDAHSCNTALVAPGTIISPGYPQSYTNNLNCSYSLATTGANRISLSFSSFTTEPGWDKVSVYDGDSVSKPLLATLSGTLNTPIVFRSTGNEMTVVFKTDNTNVFSGFMATATPII